MESEYEKASPAVQMSWEKIADDVESALSRAGFVAFRSGVVPTRAAGVRIEIDPGNNAAGGVWVRWSVDPSLSDEVGQSVLAGRLDDPSIELSAAITDAVNSAIMNVLSQFGFEVEESDDDLNPFALRVRSGRKESS